MIIPLLLKILEGFFVKSVASFDDTLTRIPVISQLTKTRSGRVAFSIGTLLALTLILIIALFFSFILNAIPYPRQVAAILIFILAVLIYFDVLIVKAEKKMGERFIKDDSTTRLTKIGWIGFLVSFITLIDDSFVLLPLFLSDHLTDFFAVIGVYLAAILQIVIVIYFGERLEKIKYKKELSAASLILLSVLVFIGVV